MAKPLSQRVRDVEARRRSQGQREIRVWVPDDPDAIARVRDLAIHLCKKEEES